MILTKVHISMNDEEYDVAAWAHTGMLLAQLLGGYIHETVGFAYIEASSWVGRTAAKINLKFVEDSKIKLPDEKANDAKPAAGALQEVPTTLSAIGGFEGAAQRKIRMHTC